MCGISPDFYMVRDAVIEKKTFFRMSISVLLDFEGDVFSFLLHGPWEVQTMQKKLPGNGNENILGTERGTPKLI